MIKLEHVKKEYPNVTPLQDVTVEVHKDDVISIIGPSGTGKSTLLHRSVRYRKEHTAALHQSAGTADSGQNLGRWN